MEGNSLDVTSIFPSLSDVLYQELRSTISGDTYRRGDPRYYVSPFYFPLPLTAILVF